MILRVEHILKQGINFLGRNWYSTGFLIAQLASERGLSLQVIGGQITCGIRHEKFALGILSDIMFSSEYITR